MKGLPVGFDDILDAAQRLQGVVPRTPLIENRLLNERLGARLLFKAECLQHTGSFKLRGAYNAVSRAEGRSVVAYSSGNHAQGVAMAARLSGSEAIIVMPSDAPRIKIDNTRAMGADVRLFDRYREEREAIGKSIAEAEGAVLIKPYDDPLVIAGQGTAGLEMAQDCRELGLIPDIAVICCGGGGLTAGCAIALRHEFSDISVHVAEPEGWDDTTRSLRSGERWMLERTVPTICDALLARTPGEITFRINRELVAGGLTADDDQVRSAMALVFRELKLVVEPGGAIALAALLAGKLDVRGKTVLVMLSGGNVDPSTFIDALRSVAAQHRA